LIGDHGYALGEKKHWGKDALWETDVRTTLVITDMRNPKKQICNRTVSLMDIFPTLCDILSVPYPKFSSGAPYLDGRSLVPLLNNAGLMWERPVLSSLEKEDGIEGSCFPQYSLRNEKFHYIRYQTNGAATFPVMPPTASCRENYTNSA